MSCDLWYCPAVEKEIAHGLCWEYCFAEIGGSVDTAYQLDRWIETTKKFKNIDDFHNVCEKCIHCQWSK
jgi:hypothetical protein